jgi:hypothetical protein
VNDSKHAPDLGAVQQWIHSELDLLHYWIVERETVRRAKEDGQSKPWTQDVLLRDYRWCNVRRMDDRVSRELFARWYPQNVSPCRGSELFLALLGRLVNWPEALNETSGHIEDARAILLARAARGEKVFTGAYVVPGVPGRSKVESVCDLVETIAADALSVLRPTMRETWQRLLEYAGIGSFLAGQVVADLAHLQVGRDWPDKQTWAPLGPGSARGINRLRGIPKDRAVSQIDFERLLPDLIAVLRPLISAIWSDRDLHAMDIQNCLCEFDKYRRLQLHEGKVRAKYDGGTANVTEDIQRKLFA